ncbi:MAG: T9SS type A sorting domain-containing protein, partial [Schleiferiaceae bacterium]|nr:T9SS type A sorting domain-containing protein [Schleiferiaceae bacterium]
STSTYHGDGFQAANRIDLVDDELLFGAKVYLSSNTVPGGILELAVYDSSAYGANGFDPNKLVAYGQKVIDAADVSRTFVRYDFTDATTGRGVELDLNEGAYFFNVTQYDNQGANYLAIRNDQTFGKLSGSGYFYLPNAPTAGWYGGYSNSLAFNNLWVRSLYCPASVAASCMLSVDENPMAELALAPNPATDYVNVSFGMLTGQYQIEVLDLTGKVVKSELVRAGSNVPVFVGNLDRGMYVVRVAKGTDVKTFKVSLL